MLVLVLFLAALLLAYFYLTSTFSHWKTKGIKYLKPYPVVGSMGSVFTLREHLADFIERIYKQYSDEQVVGFFQGTSPNLIVRDVELVKSMVIKDFSHFLDHGFTVNEELDPLQAKNLFNMEGHKWKEMRNKLSPTFTSGRMKAMFPLVLECADVLSKYMETLATSKSDIDIKDLLSRYTTDVISTCAFGVKCDSINDPQAHFRVMGRRMLQNGMLQAIKNAIVSFLPRLSKFLRLSVLDDEMTNFFRTLVQDVISFRKRTGETRNDFMQLLIQLREKGKLTSEKEDATAGKHDTHNNTKLTDDDVTAQAMVFFLAGFETSSSALTFALFELSRRPDLQQRAREEIERVLQQHEGQLTYQALQDMKYLEWIFQESLRMYPPTVFIARKCNKNYTLPGTKITIEKGTLITIPQHAIQNDAKYFPEPEVFTPERFENNKQKNNFAYLPFGEGPRQCIGFRFAQIQSKLALFAILRNFEIQPTMSTPSKIKWDSRQFLLAANKTILLQAIQI